MKAFKTNSNIMYYNIVICIHFVFTHWGCVLIRFFHEHKILAKQLVNFKLKSITI